jgi:hypothetical protein
LEDKCMKFPKLSKFPFLEFWTLLKFSDKTISLWYTFIPNGECEMWFAKDVMMPETLLGPKLESKAITEFQQWKGTRSKTEGLYAVVLLKYDESSSRIYIKSIALWDHIDI